MKEIIPRQVAFALLVCSIVAVAAVAAVLYPRNATQSGSPNLCLAQVPAGANAQYVRNATSAGTYVNANGSRTFYPEGTCPQTVPSSLYGLISSIETNAQFVAMENGSRFLYGGPGPTIGNVRTREMQQFFLFDSFNNETDYPCGPSYIFHFRVAEIQVGFPILPGGALNQSNPVMIASSSDELNIVHGCVLPRIPTFHVYPVKSLPRSFQQEAFTFSLVYNGTGYSETNQSQTTAFPGYSIVFVVSGRNSTTTPVFSWVPPCSYYHQFPCSSSRIPGPPHPNMLLMQNWVAMSWFSNITGTYLSVSAFE